MTLRLEHPLVCSTARLKLSVCGMLGCLRLVAACAGPTDVAAWVDVDAEPPADATDETSPRGTTSLQESPQGSSGARPTGGPPMTSAPPSGASTSADPDSRGPSADGSFDDEAPFIEDPSGDEALWVSGWLVTDWTGASQPWPLDVGLAEFFVDAREDLQVAVWLNGEEAYIIQDWWSCLPLSGPEVFWLDDQRFILTEDDSGAVYAVTADIPPDGTSSYLPVPEGFERD